MATSAESRRYVVAFTRFASGGIWLPQESLRHILASPGYAPGTITVNVTCMMERGFNAGQTHRRIYPSIFNRLDILIGNCNFFPPTCIYRPHWGCSHWNSGEKFSPHKTRITGLSWQWRQFDDRLNRFDTIPACDGRTDGRTDVQLWL